MPPNLDQFDTSPILQSLVARNHGFPPPTPYQRSVHAPQRVIKVFKSPNPYTKSQFGGNLAIEMGNFMGLDLWSRLQKAKEEALGIFRSRNDETEIVVDLKGPTNVILEGPSAEENTRLIGDRDGYCFKPSASAGYQSTRRDPMCKSLTDYELKLAESRLLALNFLSTGQKTNLEEDVHCGPFSPLTDEEEDLVFNALYRSNWEEVLALHKSSNIEIKRGILQCLKPDEWLNDEVINLYLELLKEREQRDSKKFLKCHYFNTFFYKKLISGRDGYDFKAVRRWTTQKKIGYSLMDCDKIFVPIHKETHWCLSVINIKERKFQYVDSLHQSGAQVREGREIEILKVLVRYIIDDVKDKCKKDVDASLWELEYVNDRPVQRSGYAFMFLVRHDLKIFGAKDWNEKQSPLPESKQSTPSKINGYQFLRSWASNCTEHMVVLQACIPKSDLSTKNVDAWVRSDCGMFMIKYIDFYSRGLILCFTQEHMPYFRKRTAKEILKLKAD